mmetsp:Transcript_82545/g.233855  ORF Transcript_82545/g.233855 Transcript_82545/m.233855 type:complete len:100 (-) Transcript_82545:268-567(-)
MPRCHGEGPGFRHAKWAMPDGIHWGPDRYAGLAPSSSSAELQEVPTGDPGSECPHRCSLPGRDPSLSPAAGASRRDPGRGSQAAVYSFLPAVLTHNLFG